MRNVPPGIAIISKTTPFPRFSFRLGEIGGFGGGEIIFGVTVCTGLEETDNFDCVGNFGVADFGYDRGKVRFL
jgi:hypothetical protein